MTGYLAAAGLVILGLSTLVLARFFLLLRGKYKKTLLVLENITDSNDIGLIFKKVIEVLKNPIMAKVRRCAVLVPENEFIDILYHENFTEEELDIFFFQRNRQMIYQSIFDARPVSKSIFGTNILPFGSSGTRTAIEERANDLILSRQKSRFQFRFMMIPVYDREIEGLILFECVEGQVFQSRDAKKMQKDMEFLNYAISRIFLLQSLSRMSVTDSLTGLLNKRQFNTIMEKSFEQALRNKDPFTVAVIDVNDFKKINDRYGHSMGDQVLRDMARLLENLVRKSDYVFRIGGDEFCILFSTTNSDMHCFEKRMEARLENYNKTEKPDEIKETVGLSIGISSSPVGQDWKSVLDQADRRMYESKTAAKSRKA